MKVAEPGRSRVDTRSDLDARGTSRQQCKAKAFRGRPAVFATNAGSNKKAIYAITNDDRILMVIAVSNNRADFGLLVNGQPAIQIKRANTELLVQNGDTTVLGGVFATDESWSQTRVPGFWRIPLIGYLFRNSAQVINRNELLVFITPHIVTRALAQD